MASSAVIKLASSTVTRKVPPVERVSSVVIASSVGRASSVGYVASSTGGMVRGTIMASSEVNIISSEGAVSSARAYVRVSSSLYAFVKIIIPKNRTAEIGRAHV